MISLNKKEIIIAICIFIIICSTVSYVIGYRQGTKQGQIPISQIADNIEYLIFNTSAKPPFVNDYTPIGYLKIRYEQYYHVSRSLLERLSYHICYTNTSKLEEAVAFSFNFPDSVFITEEKKEDCFDYKCAFSKGDVGFLKLIDDETKEVICNDN